ncbi:hypothetical protein HK102_010579, partial [Quaeritorhiza haematococci]
MGSQTVPSKLWVSFNKNCTRVSTENCDIVDDFINAILDSEKVVRQLQLPKDGKLTLHTNENEDALELDGPLENVLPTKDGKVVNDKAHPLIVKVAESAPAPT